MIYICVDVEMIYQALETQEDNRNRLKGRRDTMIDDKDTMTYSQRDRSKQSEETG